MRVLAVLCAPPRAGMPCWSELLRRCIESGHKLSISAGRSTTLLPDSVEMDLVPIFDGATGVLPPQPWLSYDAAIFSGSRFNVTEGHAFVENAVRWLRTVVTLSDRGDGCLEWASRLPLFGICFGHQLLAHALGGEVDFNPLGPELGTTPLSWTHAKQLQSSDTDPLVQAIRSYDTNGDGDRSFYAQEVHFQTVTRLPPHVDQLRDVLAVSERDAHQLVRYGSGVYGAQFHPEYHTDYMVALEHFLKFPSEKGKAEYLASLEQPASAVATAVIFEFLNLLSSS